MLPSSRKGRCSVNRAPGGFYHLEDSLCKLQTFVAITGALFPKETSDRIRTSRRSPILQNIPQTHAVSLSLPSATTPLVVLAGAAIIFSNSAGAAPLLI